MLTSDLQKHDYRQANTYIHVHIDAHKIKCGMLKYMFIKCCVE